MPKALLKKRTLAAGAVLGVVAALAIPVAFSGSPHQVQSCTVTVSGDNNQTLSISCKEAGLGDETQIHVTLSATAECINGGGNHPKAVNKESLSTEGNFPVQNGKADISLSLTASFSPSCSPPMTVEWVNILAIDDTNNITLFQGGPLP